MKKTGTVTFLVSGFILFAVAACSSRSSQREEACQKTSDCDSDLVCVAVGGGGVCRAVDFGITPSSKVCAAVQCATPDDCCTNFVPPGSCSFWNSQCQTDPVVNAAYCQEYKTQCVCDSTKYACTDDKCVVSNGCTGDPQCTGSTPHCDNGTCVQCKGDPDCATNQTCVGDVCKPKCTTDADCPIFFGCDSNTGSCTNVGCASDRECVIFEDSQFGFCDSSQTPPKCSVKCDNDNECNDGSSKPLRLCVNHQCVDTGCQSDEECKAMIGPLPAGERAICRDPPQ